MRLRMIIILLAVFAFFSASAGGWLYYFSLKKAAFQKEQTDTRSRLQLLTRQLSSYLSEHVKPVKTLASMKQLQDALKFQTALETEKANHILDMFKEKLEIEVTYLMNKKGDTIASSNRHSSTSFVGKNFSFRPYFKNAISGKSATYLALGTTSGKRGVYYSHPVYNKDTENIIGIAVIKASIEFVETTMFSKSKDFLFFVDPNGVIFISNKKQMRFGLVWKLTNEKIDTIRNSRQFGKGPWLWSGFHLTRDDFVMHNNNTKYLFSSMDVEIYPGWKIINLRKYSDIEKQVKAPFVRVIGPMVICVSIFTGIMVFILYMLASQEIAKRKSAENRLRLSEEAYRNIYHKTPVMLHSIDTKGIIIRVSDHWLDVMGYERSEIIGKKLTSFFTAKAKKYAENEIFPIFFKTGFCKDIPYTYVKKNKETIDILLSCYGVRNDQKQVIRSLAVSVDVTEKNRAQKELQHAKEKISNYSQDLEKQVKIRTRQVQKTQENLKKLSKNIIASQEREKASMARELHDHLGQVLTVMRIDAVWIEKFLAKIDDQAKNRVHKLCSLIDDTIGDVRDMAFRLRPRVLDDLGLVDAFESLLSDFEKRTNVSCVFKHDNIPQINDTVATALYRIGQEAVTNALRHSMASTVFVELKMADNRLLLTIEDNGCGFSTTDKDELNRFGMKGMKERALLVGGDLEIHSRPGMGTKISCQIDLEI